MRERQSQRSEARKAFIAEEMAGTVVPRQQTEQKEGAASSLWLAAMRKEYCSAPPRLSSEG